MAVQGAAAEEVVAARTTTRRRCDNNAMTMRRRERRRRRDAQGIPKTMSRCRLEKWAWEDNDMVKLKELTIKNTNT